MPTSPTADDAPYVAWREHMRMLGELVERHTASMTPLEVLEGGCGSSSYLKFPSRARITGIDISSEQLARNTVLHERILGDLQKYDFAPGRYDVIVCWDVLEHLDDPASTLERFSSALRPGGLLILGFPDRRSLKGLLTRVLPFRAHIWFYRWVLGNPAAGTKDLGPFPTPMRPEMAREAVIDRFVRMGLRVITDLSYESPMMIRVRDRFKLTGARWAALKWLVASASRGRIDAETTDCLLVFEKPRSPAVQ
jgi:SAM-dependent methyltransferase